jgi:hypothetical protein
MLGTEHETDAEHARAYVGAMFLAEAIVETRNIRRLLTPKE